MRVEPANASVHYTTMLLARLLEIPWPDFPARAAVWSCLSRADSNALIPYNNVVFGVSRLEGKGGASRALRQRAKPSNAIWRAT